MKAALSIAFAAAVVFASPQVKAGYVGSNVELTFEEPNNSAVLIGQPAPPPITQNFGIEMVGAGIEYRNALDWGIDISDSQIRFSLAGPESPLQIWMRPSLLGFQGFRLRDVNNDLPEIIGVSIALDSHVGLAPSQVSFDADNVLVDMELFVESGWGLTFDNSLCLSPSFCQSVQTSVRLFQPEFVLNVVFAQVDEPATLGLFGLALFGLGVSRRKRAAN